MKWINEEKTIYYIIELCTYIEVNSGVNKIHEFSCFWMDGCNSNNESFEAREDIADLFATWEF